jgi:tellurite resistance protein TehA-like permease
MALGNTPNGSFACWFQGLFTNYNYLSSIMWSTVITYQVWLIVCRKDVIKDLTGAHILCWGLPLVVTLLPLTTSTYANPEEDQGWCFVANRSDSPSWSLLFWFIVAYYLWVWIAILLNLFFMCGIAYRLYRMKEVPLRVKATIRKLIMYPIVVSFCWTPLTVWDMYTQADNGEGIHSRWDIYYGMANILAISQGFLFSSVFFMLNPMVRTAWKELFFPPPAAPQGARTSGPAGADEKSVSLVSVSINGAGSSTADEQSLRSGMISDHSRTRGNKSWFSQPISLARLQEEDDFVPAGDTPLSQRSSFVDFLASSAPQPAVSTRFSFLERVSMSMSFGRDKPSTPTGAAGSEGVHQSGREHSINPMVIEFSDFGSVRSGVDSAGTGSATMSVRRAAEEGYGSDEDEESGITTMTGGTGAGARRTSLSSASTTNSATNSTGTRVSKGSALPSAARAKK